MNSNTNCTTASATNLSVCKRRSSHISKESSGKSMKIKELFHRNLDKNIIKLCSDADLRIKVLLSNTGSGIISTSSKFTSKESTSIFGTSTKVSSRETFSKLSSRDTFTKLSLGTSTTAKTISLDTSKDSLTRSTKQKSSLRSGMKSSCHFNTEIDNDDDPINKQLTVLKIFKLKDVARRLEKRKNTIIRDQFGSTGFERSYTDGLIEGLRYGYYNNPTEETDAQTDITGKTDASEVDLPEKKESERMRGGFQDPQQQETRLKNTPEPESRIQLKQSGVTIINEYPNKCDEDVNVQAFNQKYRISNSKLKDTQDAVVLEKDLNEDRGDKFLQYFDKMLSSLGADFAKGFRAGFGDGFLAANIFVSNDKTFSEDEKEYIIQMRKCLKLSDINLENDVKRINERAEEMKKNLNIPIDEFQDIWYLLRKGMFKKNQLKFTKNDLKHYVNASKRDMKNRKITSMHEDSELEFTNYEEARDIPQHTKNRTKRYLTKHRINEFFQFLGSHLVATKPEDPITFLINLLEKCIEYRFNEFVVPPPLLFTKKHVESVYYVLDPLGTGFIDINQYTHGMEALGLKDFEDLTNIRPGEKIDRYVFITNACRRLLCKFRGMIAVDSVSVIPSNAVSEANSLF